jgi:hypothetical protein
MTESSESLVVRTATLIEDLVGLAVSLFVLYGFATVAIPVAFSFRPIEMISDCDSLIDYALLSWFLVQWVTLLVAYLVFVVGSEPEPWVQDLIEWVDVL